MNKSKVSGGVPIHIHQDLVMPNRTIVGTIEGLSIKSQEADTEQWTIWAYSCSNFRSR